MISCCRCKDLFERTELYSDLRLPGSRRRLFCYSCLLDDIEDQTAICPECGAFHIPMDLYNPPKWRNRLCSKCAIKDTKHQLFIIEKHLALSRRAGLPATLTLEEWYEALNHFHAMCAYCQIRPYQMLEHFIPGTLGGGTTASNCVPSCYSCNSMKRNIHPDQSILHPCFSKEGLESVRYYLQSK